MLVEDAIQISLKKEKVSLENVQQFYYKCQPKEKIEFVKSIFDAFSQNT
jgi:superfamily II DNA/RNA helicase